jgi:hypothetical protein
MTGPVRRGAYLEIVSEQYDEVVPDQSDVILRAHRGRCPLVWESGDRLDHPRIGGPAYNRAAPIPLSALSMGRGSHIVRGSRMVKSVNGQWDFPVGGHVMFLWTVT